MDESLAADVRSRDRERWLSILWAPAAARPALVALHAYDLEQQRIVAEAKEPLLAEIKLAWWREQLDAIGRGGVPQAQPILRALAAESGRPLDLTLLTLSEEGFLPLLLDGESDAAQMARARGAPLFHNMAQAIHGRVLTDAEAEAASRGGAIWAFGRLLRGPWGQADERLAGMRVPPPDHATVPDLPAPLAGLVGLALDDWREAAAGRTLKPAGTFGRYWRFFRAAR